MTEPLTNEYLDKVKKRCNAATKGPWISFIEGRDHLSGSSVIIRGLNGSEDDLYLSGATEQDQDFISHARQDILILLSEIERLQRLLLNK